MGDDDMADMSGWVTLEYNDDDEMVIDYSISSGPKRCDTCKLAIYDGDSCDDLGDPYYDTEENPWTKDDDRRNLSSNERGLKHKSKKKKGPKKIACGQLIPDDADERKLKYSRNTRF